MVDNYQIHISLLLNRKKTVDIADQKMHSIPRWSGMLYASFVLGPMYTGLSEIEKKDESMKRYLRILHWISKRAIDIATSAEFFAKQV